MMNHCLSAAAGRVQVQVEAVWRVEDWRLPIPASLLLGWAGLGWAGLGRADVMFAAFC